MLRKFGLDDGYILNFTLLGAGFCYVPLKNVFCFNVQLSYFESVESLERFFNHIKVCSEQSLPTVIQPHNKTDTLVRILPEVPCIMKTFTVAGKNAVYSQSCVSSRAGQTSPFQ